MMPHLSRRRLLKLGGTSLATASIWAPALALGATPLLTLEGRAFGARWLVTLPAGANTAGLRPAIETLLADIDQKMSPWRPDSEITAFNRAPAGSQTVSPETGLVAQAALDAANLSDGWFNPAVGPLVAQWGFGPIEGTTGRAAPWAHLAAAPDALSKTEIGLTFDLCGIAKGYALDRMATTIADFGHEHFLIDLGGELKAQGHHPEGRIWQVAIEDPRQGFEAPAGALQLDGLAVATSGQRAQSYQVGPTIYSHIIDPQNGMPVQSTTASVSVLASDGMSADAWATALAAAGVHGPALAEQAGIAALFLVRQPAGLSRITTAGFGDYLL